MTQWLNDILLASGVTGILLGVGFLLIPERIFKEQSQWRQWLLERDMAALLNRYQRIEKPLYRHHRLVGAALTAGALTLLTLIGKFSHLYATSAWGQILGVRLAILFAWALGLMALIIGIFLLVRPSALKGVETLANRWVTPFPSSMRTNSSPGKVNPLILRFPRRAGILLLLAGTACLLLIAD